MKTQCLRLLPRSVLFLSVLLAASAGLVGCDSGNDSDHRPPAGMGSIVVDNHATEGLEFYLNGTRTNNVGGTDTRTVDLNPGVYRVTLLGRSSVRSWTEDVDVLVNRLTFLDVTADPVYSYRFDVFIYYRD